jgi:hypothetical protein
MNLDFVFENIWERTLNQLVLSSRGLRKQQEMEFFHNIYLLKSVP